MGGGPYYYRFESNDTRYFILQITIPMETENRTTNTVVISGTWKAEAHPASKIKDEGSAAGDEIKITVLKKLYLNESEEYLGEDDELIYWLDQNYQLVLVIIICSVLIITMIILGYFSIRKRFKKDS